MIIKCPKCNKVFDSTKAMGKKEVCEHCEAVFVIDDSVVYDPKSDQKVAKDRKVGKTPAKRKKTALIVFVCGVLLVVVIGGGYFIARNRGLLNNARQKTADSLARIQQEQALKDKIEAEVEKRIADERYQQQQKEKKIAEERYQQEQKEIRKRKNAYKQVKVSDWDYNRTVGGGANLNYIVLNNSTGYYFEWIEYEFYDAVEKAVRDSGKLGPLAPQQTKKFTMKKHVRCWWENQHGLRLVAGKVPK